METYLNTWLVGFAVEINGVEMMVYHMVSVETPELAEAGAMMMGRNWWEDGKAVTKGIAGYGHAGVFGLTASFCSTMLRAVFCEG